MRRPAIKWERAEERMGGFRREVLVASIGACEARVSKWLLGGYIYSAGCPDDTKPNDWGRVKTLERAVKNAERYLRRRARGRNGS